MESLKALRIKIYQPQAHYRIPFTYQRRHTYPIPPYSTVLGLIANVLGIKNLPDQEEPCMKIDCDCDYHKLKEIKLAVCGNFQSRTTEYIWLRNLSEEYHKKRFGTVENRSVSGRIEHIGGQSPCLIDILNDVTILIYLHHEDESFLEKIKTSFENPVKRSGVMHLGRAEDWIVPQQIEFVQLVRRRINGNYGYFFWVCKRSFGVSDSEIEKVNGVTYNLPTFYKIREGFRIFSYLPTKLNDGDMADIETYFDEKEGLPVFLALLGEVQNG